MPINRPSISLPSTLYRGVRSLHCKDFAEDNVRIWGGIAWPTLRGPVGAERVEGFACLVAESIDDRVCTVYEQTIWTTVEPEAVPGRAVERGLVTHLQEWYAVYGSTCFSCAGRRDTERETWEPQVRQSRILQPQPLLRDEHIDDASAFAEIMTRVQAGQFRHAAGEPVDLALQTARNDRSDVGPPLMAVAAALKGIRTLGVTIVELSPEQRNTPGAWARVFRQQNR